VKNLLILLVEDDPDDIELLQSAFKDDQVQYEMDIVMQGDVVLPHLNQMECLPDLIILDLNLPRLHGKEVLQLIKGSASFQNIPVVILTTSSASRERDICQQMGAELFLTKPSTIEGFKAVIRAILNVYNNSRL